MWSIFAYLHVERTLALRVDSDPECTRSPNAIIYGRNHLFKSKARSTDICRLFRLHTERKDGKARHCRAPDHIDSLIGVTTAQVLHKVRAAPHFAFHEHQTFDSALMVYFSNAPVNGPRQSATDTRGNTYDDAVDRVIDAWRYVGKGCLNVKFRWYFQIDDDAAISVPRLRTFQLAIERKLGSPEGLNAVFGMQAIWVKPKEELFGGRGLLATIRAMNATAMLEDKRYDSVHKTEMFGDAALSALMHIAKCRIVKMQLPFGLGTEWQDEVGRNFTYNASSAAKAAAISLHKVKTTTGWERAAAIFNQSPAPRMVYEEAIGAACELR